ncbi:MAG: hypothetical protein ABI670_21795 [Chloroflexota bacterium]
MVLPNTEATISLPGPEVETLKVGAGTHRWTRPYPKPAARQALPLDNTLDEIVGDVQAWTMVRSIIARRMPDLAEQIDSGGGISGTGSLSVRQVLAMRPNIEKMLEELEASLTARNQ